jgi:protein-disulfide isomerase
MAFATQQLKGALDVTSTLAMLLAALYLIWSISGSGMRADNRPNTEPETVSGRIDGASTSKSLGTGRVTLVEFADFECPFCRRHAADVLPQVERELVAKQEARYVFLHFPLSAIHPHAEKASEAAECAGRQGRYWDMHRRLFSGEPKLEESALVHHAQQLSLNAVEFERCLAGEAAATIKEDVSLGEAFGVKGTPTFLVGVTEADGSVTVRRRINGVATFEAIRREIRRVAEGG